MPPKKAAAKGGVAQGGTGRKGAKPGKGSGKEGKASVVTSGAKASKQHNVKEGAPDEGSAKVPVAVSNEDREMELELQRLREEKERRVKEMADLIRWEIEEFLEDVAIFQV